MDISNDSKTILSYALNGRRANSPDTRRTHLLQFDCIHYILSFVTIYICCNSNWLNLILDGHIHRSLYERKSIVDSPDKHVEAKTILRFQLLRAKIDAAAIGQYKKVANIPDLRRKIL